MRNEKGFIVAGGWISYIGWMDQVGELKSVAAFHKRIAHDFWTQMKSDRLSTSRT